MANASLDPNRLRTSLIDFDGRVGRSRFALVAIGVSVALPPMIDLAVLCLKVLGAPLPSRDIPSILSGVTLPEWLARPVLVADGLGIAVIAFVLLSFEVRRLHDLNATGWLVLAFPVLSLLPFPDIDPLPSIASLVWFALLGVIPGTNGPNAYGPISAIGSGRA